MGNGDGTPRSRARSRSLFCGCSAALLLFTPSFVLAEDVAKTGTLMAAAFETFGYQAQSQVLLNLSQMLRSLAALIFLGTIISAIITASFLGLHKGTVWLLVGPPLFFFLVFKSTDAAGVEWKLGVFKDVRGDLKKVVKAADYHAEGTTVSWFFHQYNKLVSDVVQQGVSVLTRSNIRPQMMFMARQSVMDHIFGSLTQEPPYVALLAFFHAHCANEIADASLIALAQREQAKLTAPANPAVKLSTTGSNIPVGFMGTPDYAAAVQRYCQSFPMKNKPFPPGPWWDQVVGMGILPCTSADGTFQLKDAQAGKRITCSVSCLDMWRWVVPAAVIANRSVINFAVDKNVEPYARFTKNVVEDILKDVRDGITGGGAAATRLNQPCPMSGNAVNAPGVPNGSPEAEKLAKALIPKQIRMGLVGDPRSNLIAQVTAHSGITLQRYNTHPADNPARKDDIANRYRSVELAHSAKYEAFWLMNTLPQIQGMILYVLAATYPFFALTVLIPGQAGAFFGWCALWAWAKSWDIGWALMMLADEILWSLLPKSAYYHFEGGSAADKSVWDSPVNVLEAAFGGDNSFTLGNYWLLLSLMLASVPLLTAQAIMGSKKAMLGILFDGLRNFGSRLGGSAGDWEAHRNVERLDVTSNLSVIGDFQNKADKWKKEEKDNMEALKAQQDSAATALNLARKTYDAQIAALQSAQDWVALQAVDPNGILAKAGYTAGDLADTIQDAAKAVDDARVATANAAAEGFENATDWFAGTRAGRFMGAKKVEVPFRAVPVIDERKVQRAAEIKKNLEGMHKILKEDYERGLQNAVKKFGEAEKAAKQAWNVTLKNVSKVAALVRVLSPFETFDMMQLAYHTPGEDRQAPRSPASKLLVRLAEADMKTQGWLIEHAGFPEVMPKQNSMDVHQNKELLAEMERQRFVADWYEVGSNATLVTAAGVAYLGKGKGVSIPAAIALTNYSYELRANALDINRAINGAQRDRIEINTEVWFADSMRSPERLFREELRAAISNRGEWWNTPELPIGAEAQSRNTAARLRVQIDAIHGRTVGEASWVVVGTFSKGKAVTALH